MSGVFGCLPQCLLFYLNCVSFLSFLLSLSLSTFWFLSFPPSSSLSISTIILFIAFSSISHSISLPHSFFNSYFVKYFFTITSFYTTLSFEAQTNICLPLSSPLLQFVAIFRAVCQHHFLPRCLAVMKCISLILFGSIQLFPLLGNVYSSHFRDDI